ncbi:hypothetical protein LTR36_002142 [Oleoguttula mirabilis]|uniref:TauD/TfdA-like domain-containing protein n=1 Tax=Oleoguttula mirabilis TaxID=1507867 RepID=A0AAV9JM83_9PEZI|nr:hypothetical protein LTR36_002142 [Oleoguttula mirabilis]
MPHKDDSTAPTISITELHPTFAAEVRGVDFSQDLPPAVFQEIYEAITKYGVVKFPDTGLDDAGQVAFAAKFGELDDVTPYTKQGKKHRLAFEQLFDVSNLLDDGSVAPLDSHRAAMNQGNSLFHVDSSFNPRRGGYSLLRAHELPPKGTGGATEYADARTAFDELPEDLRKELLGQDYVACHSLYHSRKTAAPGFLLDIKPEDHFMSRHKLVQRHEPSGRMNLYIASHVHHIEGWTDNGDLILWDNTCVMHRATGGSFAGKYVRDMRRATVHDGSVHAWGLNEPSSDRMGYP